MKRYEFDGFRVDDGNRAAFEICHAVAELQPVSPLPIILVAEPGRGKTHLLYAIVNELREKQPRTALAYITSREFPDKARGLIEDPTPIERATSAVLLVDQLERFTERVVDLEAIVQAFLDRGHYVILASCLAPNRLGHLPSALRAMLDKGQTVYMPRDGKAATVSPSSAATGVSPRVAAPQQDEIRRLREELSRLEEKAAALPSAQDLERELAQERARCRNLEERVESSQVREKELERQIAQEREQYERFEELVESSQVAAKELERHLEQERERCKDLREQAESQRAAEEELAQELERARNESRTLQRDLEKARDACAQIPALEEEVKRLNAYADHLHSEQEADERVRATVVAQLAEKGAVEEELHAAHIRLQVESEERTAEENRWNERLMAVVAGIEGYRNRFVKMAETANEKMRQLEGLLPPSNGPEPSVDENVARLRAWYESRIAELQEAAARMTEDAVADLRRQLKDQAAQVAAAEAERAELEQLRRELDFTRGSGHVVAAGIQNLREQIAQTADALGTLADRTRQACGTEAAADEDPWDGPNEEL